jgi:hypothetical protein
VATRPAGTAAAGATATHAVAAASAATGRAPAAATTGRAAAVTAAVTAASTRRRGRGRGRGIGLVAIRRPIAAGIGAVDQAIAVVVLAVRAGWLAGGRRLLPLEAPAAGRLLYLAVHDRGGDGSPEDRERNGE